MNEQGMRAEIQRLDKKVKKLKQQRVFLLIPFVLLTLPISVPIIAAIALQKRYAKFAKSKESITHPRSPTTSPKPPIKPAISSLPMNEAETTVDGVLIWCPIAIAGLTTQLEQLTAILRDMNVAYKISYHVKPKIRHPENANWIDPEYIRNPRVVFFMERYVPFETGFFDSFHVYYINLDWLSPQSISAARVYADLVIAPTAHRFDEIVDLFPNSKVKLLPWPAASAIEVPEIDEPPSTIIRILYVGNDYGEKSRKSPFEVVDAILCCERTDLRFDLKFRSPLPTEVRKRLEACEIVDNIIDFPLSGQRIESLYRKADINLAPNCSEGNGLSILESYAKGVVPAVLKGHPMIDVVSPENGYFIECTHVGDKEFAPLYATSADAIGRFFAEIDRAGITSRQRAIREKQRELRQRQQALEDLVSSVLAMKGLVEPPDYNNTQEDEHGLGNLPLAHSDWYKQYSRETKLIDVFMTTCRRPNHFGKSLAAVIKAMELSRYKHRLTVFSDGFDAATNRIIEDNKESIFQYVWTQEVHGLPYAWNTLLDTSSHMSARTEEVPDFICYLQDDALIANPEEYFEVLVRLAEAFEPGQLGFVSGYYTELHPGYRSVAHDGREIIFSGSIDGKNFLARPKTMYSIGKLTWWFPDGMRRGNPGPVRGSHFDLWQWKESPRNLLAQQRVNAIVPGLVTHTASDPEDSTWNNDTTTEGVQRRIAKGKIYHTRSSVGSAGL